MTQQSPAICSIRRFCTRYVQNLSHRAWLKNALESAEAKVKHHIPISKDLAYNLVLKCTKEQDLELGRRMQSLIAHSGLDSVAILADHLIRLFASHGDLEEAQKIFDNVTKPSLYTWNAIIAAYAKLGQGKTSLQFYTRMQHEGTNPDKFTFLSILKACSHIEVIDQGRLIHRKITENGLQYDLILGCALVDMYAKCGCLNDAWQVFDSLADPNVVTWGAIIAGYAKNGKGLLALACFSVMQNEGLESNKAIFLSALKACSSITSKEYGKCIHEQIIESRLDSDIALGSTLVDMYAKCGDLDMACKIFGQLSNLDAITWSTMIAGYVQHGEGSLALECYERMQQKCIRPTIVTFLSIFKACTMIGAIEQGRCIHEHIFYVEFHSNTTLGNTLVDMYVKCGSLNEADMVFSGMPNRTVVTWNALLAGYAYFGKDLALECFCKMKHDGIRPDVVTWATLIAGFVQHGENLLALEYFQNMQNEGIKPSKVTFLSALKVCCNLGAVEQGRYIHEQIMENSLQEDIVVANTLVDMYAKCNSFPEACVIFNKLTSRDVVSWNTLIAGYAQHEKGLIALDVFETMQLEGINSCEVTLLAMLKACGCVGAINKGRLFHEHAIEKGIECNILVGNAIVDMYSKSGNLKEAEKVFSRLLISNVAAWNAMIAGYAQTGQAGLAVQCLEGMRNCGNKPDHIAFTGILTAISRSGLVEEGCWYFKIMKEQNGLVPDVVHITCLMDLLGRAGHFREAESIFHKVHVGPDSCLQLALLGACNTYANMALGRQSFSNLIHLDASSAAAYVLMSNIYANAYMWENVNKGSLEAINLNKCSQE